MLSCASTGEQSPVNSSPLDVFAKEPNSDFFLHKIKSNSSALKPVSNEELEEAIAKSKNDLQTSFYLSSQGNYLEAQRIARDVLSKKPGNDEAMFALVTALAGNKQLGLAAHHSRQLLQSSKYKAAALNIIGLHHLSEASHVYDIKKAWKYLIDSFNASTDQVASGLNLGYLYLQAGHFKNAQEVFKSTAQRCNDCRDALLGMGIAAMRNDGTDLAEQSFKTLLARQPKDLPAKYYLALNFKNNRNDKKNAGVLLEQIIAEETVGFFDVKERAELALDHLEGKRPINDEFFRLDFGGNVKSESRLTKP